MPKYTSMGTRPGCAALVWPNGLTVSANIVVEDGAFLECTSLSAKARSQIVVINPNALDRA